MEYIDLGPPIVKSVGDKFVVGIRLTEWLGSDGVDSTSAAVQAGITSVTVGAAQVNSLTETINDKATPPGEAVLVPIEIVDGDVAMARVLVDIQSSNPNKRVNDRAIPIRIVG